MQEITLYADRGNAEAIGDMLMEAGASSYTTQDADADTPSESPLFGEPGLEPKVQAWNRSLLTVLADDGFDWKTSLAVIEKALGIEKLEVKSVEAVPDVDWVRITQAQFQPIQASRRLWIVPSWSEPPSPDALNMKLDPGVAFGTGSHPTTHLCIQWLDENLKKNPLKCEYFLPFVVDELIREGKAEVTVLKSHDRWHGVTYKEDKPVVMKAMQDLKDAGKYPQNLWEE